MEDISKFFPNEPFPLPNIAQTTGLPTQLIVVKQSAPCVEKVTRQGITPPNCKEFKKMSMSSSRILHLS